MNPAQQFLALVPRLRALVFEEAATRRSVDSVIIEKDFWVCWLLGVLFSQTALGPHLVFKGGTSLSKVFGVIDRFSEDVDLSVSPEFVGADGRAFDALSKRTQRDAAMAEMQRQCRVKTEDTIAPLLEEAVHSFFTPSTIARPINQPRNDTRVTMPTWLAFSNIRRRRRSWGT